MRQTATSEDVIDRYDEAGYETMCTRVVISYPV